VNFFCYWLTCLKFHFTNQTVYYSLPKSLESDRYISAICGIYVRVVSFTLIPLSFSRDVLVDTSGFSCNFNGTKSMDWFKKWKELGIILMSGA